MASKKLFCDKNNKLTISYQNLLDSGVVLIFCQKDDCYTKFGQKPIWKIKNNAKTRK